jgi:hypothetical protein
MQLFPPLQLQLLLQLQFFLSFPSGESAVVSALAFLSVIPEGNPL